MIHGIVNIPNITAKITVRIAAITPIQKPSLKVRYVNAGIISQFPKKTPKARQRMKIVDATAVVTIILFLIVNMNIVRTVSFVSRNIVTVSRSTH